MRVNDVVIGSVLLIVSVSAAIYASQFPSVPGRHFGAWTFPMVLGGLLAASSALLIVQGITAKPDRQPSLRPSWTTIINVLLICLAPIVYVFAVPVVGFIPGVFVIGGGITYRLWGGIRRSLLLALIATLTVDATFRGLLHVPLPLGLISWTPW